MENLHTLSWNGFTLTFNLDNNTATIESQSSTILDLGDIWNEFLSSDTCTEDTILNTIAVASRPKKIIGTDEDDQISSDSNGGIVSGNGDDSIIAVAQEGTGQFHTFAGNGNDQTILKFSEVSSYSHGHHSRGGLGFDTFEFEEIDRVSGVIIGRIEDFDYSRDKILISGQLIDLFALPENVRLVEYNGDHNDANNAPQFWLIIKTQAGGTIFYALDGARVDMSGDGGANDGQQEAHFVSIPDDFDFDELEDVEFFDKKNYIPDGYATTNGLKINDIDRNVDDVNEIITGSSFRDLIAAGLNDDVVFAGSGNDAVWGGDGKDILYGERHKDLLEGGSERDIIYGGGGRDVIHGDQGNDLLFGGKGSDFIYGGDGNDEIIGGKRNDKLFGGGGSDTFIFKKNDGVDKIFDFQDGSDIIQFNTGSFDDLTFTTFEGGALIEYGNDDQIYLYEVSVDELTQEDFIFI